MIFHSETAAFDDNGFSVKENGVNAGPPPIPNKLYFKIGEVATMVGMSATMLRSWERLGLIRPVRTDSSYRLYTGDDVARLKQARS